MSAPEYYRHMPVYLAGGRRLGFLLEVGHAVDVLRVQEGRLMVQDWYVPVSAVRDVDNRGVFLALTREDLRRDQMHVPPESYLARQGATPGYEYTSRADIPPYGETEPPADAATA